MTPGAEPLPVKLIVAHDELRGIGRGGTMPWHIPGESRWTSETTRAAQPGHRNALIMGRTTYLSIPENRRPLFDRINIVISSHHAALDDGAHRASGLREALRLADAIDNVNAVYIFGGASIYRQALEQLVADELLVSVVPGDHQCDTFFPEIPSVYSLTTTTTVQYGPCVVRHDRYVRTADYAPMPR
ncbi:hypothetical protein AN480_28225 (plasmid) [Mycobacterium intracellulare subsp. chimaera]|uniref:dihydrofolate reductase n=1 Tax=Mycobacterium intracellulare subsp. chimaera TaxID=222805 RepID=A0ABT7P606_MYCIT|nr:dihydrofolate reductase [Mycobacterium intracellulare]AOS94932.1 hypothetical protein AN480_28225 [Mycobacterium intracellulare subsp. chimaera]MDM3928716.1 dihydrofolate reductase [Mycobacterium intracellulare subsp. chimaera]